MVHCDTRKYLTGFSTRSNFPTHLVPSSWRLRLFEVHLPELGYGAQYLGGCEDPATVAIEARTLKRRRVATSGAEVPAVPKMELLGSKESKNLATKSRKYGSLAALIKAFGEFILIADAKDVIIGFWASRQPSAPRFPKAIFTRRLGNLVEPTLLAKIRTIADRTATRHAREEVECSFTIGGLRRWFSVSALPLGTAGYDHRALCIAARNVTHRVEAMQTLSDREALLAKAEEVANFGSCEMDLKTNKVKLSAHLMKIYELPPDQKWSQEIYWERMHPDDRIRAQRLLDSSRKHGQPVKYISRYCALDGSVRVHLALSLPVLDESGKAVRSLGVIHDITEHAKSYQELQRLSQQLLKEQDTQRRHLARELHESAGQSLASLKMTLGRLREAITDNPELVSELLDSAGQLADGAIREVRTVTYLLHPPLLDDAGLGPALRWYTKGFMERSGISTTLNVSEPFPRLRQDIETTVFRVVQEALTNVHRYSGSASAEIKLWHADSKLCVEIRDRGCGFPPAEEPSQQPTKLGVGISGMRERVKQLNGEFEISSVPGRGTTVHAVFPAVPVRPVVQLSQARAGSRG
jgi:signal transduction histidine kinase